jgi:hypothetical protein
MGGVGNKISVKKNEKLLSSETASRMSSEDRIQICEFPHKEDGIIIIRTAV